MLKPCLLAVALSLAFALLGGQGQATTIVSNFKIKINIGMDCTIAATDLDFGTKGVLTSAVDAASAITVTCGSGLPYQIELNQGAGLGATTANRLLTGPGGATIAYTMYLDSGRTAVWGNVFDSDKYSGNGTGATQIVPIYGRAFQQATPGSGLYSDTVTMTVTY